MRGPPPPGKACGGRTTSAVSSKTTHLIAGDALDDGRPTSSSSKYVKAAALGVAIISEGDFRAMLRDPDPDFIAL